MTNDYVAIDSGGNALSLQAWIAEKTNKQSTKIITELVGGSITTYKMVKDLSPVLAFHHEQRIRRMILITEHEQIRGRNYVGFRYLNFNLADCDALTTEVYRRIIFF